MVSRKYPLWTPAEDEKGMTPGNLLSVYKQLTVCFQRPCRRDGIVRNRNGGWPCKELESLMAAKKVKLKLGDTPPRKWKDDWSKRIRSMLELSKLEAIK